VKNILNNKTVAWVYVGLGVLILFVQFYKTVPGATFDWFRYVPGGCILAIGIFRLARLQANN
jgi:hypothetical protein